MTPCELAQSVVKKIQMVKLLYELASECLQSRDNPEKTGAGMILLQDSVEMFLVAVCEHMDASLDASVAFDKYFVELKKKTGEDAPLKTQMLALNRQRVGIKHHGVLPHIDNCRSFAGVARNFFVELSTRYLSIEFDSITLVDLLEEGEVKTFLQQAQGFFTSSNYRDCQINCRKALYLTLEKSFDIRPFEKDEDAGRRAFARVWCKAPDWTKDPEYIKRQVRDPTDYIKLDHHKLETELSLDGIIAIAFWNVWRLTPPVYYYEDEAEWVVKDMLGDDVYSHENAEYCIRTTTDILLQKQRRFDQTRSIREYGVLVKLKRGDVKLFQKASLNSEVALKLTHDSLGIYSRGLVRGLDDKRLYHSVLVWNEDKAHTFIGSGYVCEDNVQRQDI